MCGAADALHDIFVGIVEEDDEIVAVSFIVAASSFMRPSFDTFFRQLSKQACVMGGGESVFEVMARVPHGQAAPNTASFLARRESDAKALGRHF